MSSERIRADYPTLEGIASTFEREQERIQQVQNSLSRHVDILRNGGWKSDSADQFYREMDDDILPSVGRLAAALGQAAESTRDIVRIFKAAEQEAANALRDADNTTAHSSETAANVGEREPLLNLPVLVTAANNSFDNFMLPLVYSSQEYQPRTVGKNTVRYSPGFQDEPSNPEENPIRGTLPIITNLEQWWIDLEARALVWRSYSEQQVAGLSFGRVENPNLLLRALSERADQLDQETVALTHREVFGVGYFMGLFHAFTGVAPTFQQESPAPIIGSFANFGLTYFLASRLPTPVPSVPIRAVAIPWMIANAYTYASAEVSDSLSESYWGQQNSVETAFEQDVNLISGAADATFNRRLPILYRLSDGNLIALEGASYADNLRSATTLRNLEADIEQHLSAAGAGGADTVITSSYVYVVDGQYYMDVTIGSISPRVTEAEIQGLRELVSQYDSENRDVSNEIRFLAENGVTFQENLVYPIDNFTARHIQAIFDQAQGNISE